MLMEKRNRIMKFTRLSPHFICNLDMDMMRMSNAEKGEEEGEEEKKEEKEEEKEQEEEEEEQEEE